MKTITKDLINWYQLHKRDLPWRKTKNSYYIWVSEIMLQQTRVEAVINYYEKFIARFPTIKDFAAASEDEILKYWEGLGYYSRVRNMHASAKMLVEKNMDELPSTKEKLLLLPGIGSYTAGAILSIAYLIPTVAIDGNVIRIIARLYAIDVPFLKNEKLYSSYVTDLLPQKNADLFTQAFMDLGSMICLPKNPKCEICPLSKNCKAMHAKTVLKYPVKILKTKQKVEERSVFLFVCKEKIAIQKREASGLLASMYEFPNELFTPTDIEVENYLHAHDISYSAVLDIGNTKHVFSHIIWYMHGFVILVDEPFGDYLWVTKEELQEVYSIPSAFSFFLKQYMDRF